ncbi:uncharacterized protein SCHCODRAFT_01228011 [Schizophyllum commune H4-8]|uniref:uncharacterized protein n=1 Tax=Schizophyllum commune (strain H4-8 / FGSC 9210) TaxID=578458 RepID=UPI0021600364|nr:uncharacterized protein SCHCODRAFT_01228011 [Schizophyllum commune H4-8]KAI5894358.1 hypothetical protein SCHCODRAFT_01228011 [Schizophyllum commune H4-8]
MSRRGRLPQRTGPTPPRQAPRRARGRALRAARSTNTTTSRRPRAPPKTSPPRAQRAPRIPTPTCQIFLTQFLRAGVTSNDVFGRPSPRSGAGVWYPSCSGPSRRGSPRSFAATSPLMSVCRRSGATPPSSSWFLPPFLTYSPASTQPPMHMPHALRTPLPTWPAFALRPSTETYAEYMYMCMVCCYLCMTPASHWPYTPFHDSLVRRASLHLASLHLALIHFTFSFRILLRLATTTAVHCYIHYHL